jgi:KamA family protein
MKTLGNTESEHSMIPLQDSTFPIDGRKLRTYTVHNFRKIPAVQKLTEDEKFAIEVVAQVLPFKTNGYVVDELINWDDVPNDPIYRLTFPQAGMLKARDFATIADLLHSGAGSREIRAAADQIRLTLNPQPAGQLDSNLAQLHGSVLRGIQHKYNETVLFFPEQGQTCHAYCTFCFRWPQFTGMHELKLAMRDVEQLIEYVRQRPEVTDILFTGGDPLTMSAKVLGAYIQAIVDADIPHLQVIRIGSKVLGFWPYRFLTDGDAEELLKLFRSVVQAGKHVAIMAHFTHPRELQTKAVQEAIRRLRATGAEIRTQAPLLAHINADPDVWAEMWRQQVRLGMHPYYMFVTRDTGAQHYFAVPLVRAWEIFRQAYQQVSGLGRTARGPSMSAYPGKVQIVGVTEVQGEKVFVLQFLQGRNPDWALQPFFATYDEEAIWFDELRPAFGEQEFFFQKKQHADPQNLQPASGLSAPSGEGGMGRTAGAANSLRDGLAGCNSGPAHSAFEYSRTMHLATHTGDQLHLEGT